jgi:hypothetical protein
MMTTDLILSVLAGTRKPLVKEFGPTVGSSQTGGTHAMTVHAFGSKLELIAGPEGTADCAIVPLKMWNGFPSVVHDRSDGILPAISDPPYMVVSADRYFDDIFREVLKLRARSVGASSERRALAPR